VVYSFAKMEFCYSLIGTGEMLLTWLFINPVWYSIELVLLLIIGSFASWYYCYIYSWLKNSFSLFEFHFFVGFAIVIWKQNTRRILLLLLIYFTSKVVIFLLSLLSDSRTLPFFLSIILRDLTCCNDIIIIDICMIIY